MPSVQIKNVPAETHAELRRRAAARHQSLQEYLLELLTHQARVPSLEEWIERVSQREGGVAPTDEVVALIRAERDSR
jgi:plasmid stability protein